MENENYTSRPSRQPRSFASSILGIVFGIFMFLVYEGMGVLMFINFFGWNNSWAWTRWIVGVVLVIYGFFRAYRTYNDITHNHQND